MTLEYITHQASMLYHHLELVDWLLNFPINWILSYLDCFCFVLLDSVNLIVNKQYNLPQYLLKQLIFFFELFL